MTQSYTREEFVEYVKELEIDNLEQMVDLVLEYFDYYEKLPEEAENKELAWEKYCIVIAMYGINLADYAKKMINMRKTLEMPIKQKENFKLT